MIGTWGKFAGADLTIEATPQKRKAVSFKGQIDEQRERTDLKGWEVESGGHRERARGNGREGRTLAVGRRWGRYGAKGGRRARESVKDRTASRRGSGIWGGRVDQRVEWKKSKSFHPFPVHTIYPSVMRNCPRKLFANGCTVLMLLDASAALFIR
jgi:hypothetical protein